MTNRLPLLKIAICIFLLNVSTTTPGYAAESIESISAFSPITNKEFEAQLLQINKKIKQTPKAAELFLQRGTLYLSAHQFMEAILDYDTAIEEGDLDDAYFGRGLAKGRIQEFDSAIADMDVYIKRHPDSSLAYTKRGIRNLWRGTRDQATSDFMKAIELNPDNAEANDDLGVIYAQNKNYEKAITHFSRAIKIEPSYQKAYHNLAMVYYLTEQDLLALASVNQGLEIRPDTKNSMLLKAEILKSLGMNDRAQEILEEAEFLGEGNWSERAPVQSTN